MSSLPPSGPASHSPPPCDYPLKLEPIFVERVWGQEDLSFLYPSRPAEPRPVGEVWLTGDQNRIANGVAAGIPLGELAQQNPQALLGPSVGPGRATPGPAFPLLIKFLFTTDKLSVQVHPPDPYAQTRENSSGKTEMWHVLKAEPGAQLAVGFRRELARNPRMERSELRQAVESGAIETMLDWMEVRPGETFFVPAGTVHAIGAGLVLCEIQQNSDVTYRFYDYNRPGMDGRPRHLHLEQALDVLEWSPWGGRTVPLEFSSVPGRSCLAACPYFAAEKVSFHSPFRHPGRNQAEVWVALEGAARVEAGEDAVECQRGEALVLPAALSSVSIHPLSPSVFLRTFLPGSEADILAPLRACGLSEEQLRRVCFFSRPAAWEGRT